jgi:hypothetical protein
MNERANPSWDELPDEFRQQFKDEQMYEQWQEAQSEQAKDLATDQPSRIAVGPDLKAIAQMAAAYPSPAGHGLNRQMSTDLFEQIDPEGVNVLKPLLLHRYVGGQPTLKPHMRAMAWIKKLGQAEAVELTLDVPMEAWEQLPTIDEYDQKTSAVAQLPGNASEVGAASGTHRLAAVRDVGGDA